MRTPQAPRLLQAFVNLNGGLPGTMRARPVFFRESSALMYHPWTYQLATFCAEIPWLALSLALGPTISYFMIGLGASGGAFAFAVNYLTVFLLSLTMVLLGNTVANASPSFEMAQAAIGAITPILMLYAGLYSKGSCLLDHSSAIDSCVLWTHLRAFFTHRRSVGHAQRH
jgi:hypothetical protein